MDEKKRPLIAPEPIHACDDSGVPILCPTCGQIPCFTDDDDYYYVSCDCEVALTKKDEQDNLELLRQGLKNSLFEKWLIQVYGICPPCRRIEGIKGWN